ncbi:hypothetical protein [Myxococcus landrumensis]|uniref:hypothetical protein n=1 Tax=Myxococcus landrumensis TaxID=2813577 RepID=UPI001F5084E5|nr:hypothetical protein [Myxococcus landrumus]
MASVTSDATCWECAAKRLIERWFAPLVKGLKHVTKDRSFTASSPTIVFEALVEHPQTKVFTVERAYTKNNFKTGDNVFLREVPTVAP